MRRHVGALAGALLIGAACGGNVASGETTGASGVASSKNVNELSRGELGRLCDWIIAQLTSTDCFDVDEPSDSVRSSCVNEPPPCAFTVDTVETCYIDLTASTALRCDLDVGRVSSCRELECDDVDEAVAVGAEPIGEDPNPPPTVAVYYGLPCAECPVAECYVPGTTTNPICSQRCSTDDDCGRGGVCQASGNTGKWCFRECETDADCTALNDHPSNPLFCAESYDADNDYYEGSGPLVHRFCVQESEP